MRSARKLYSFLIRATYPFVAVGKKLSVYYPCTLNRKSARHIRLGDFVIIRKDCWLNIISDEADGVKLEIGDNCSIGYRTTISVKNSVAIERDVIVAASVLIQDHNHAYEDIGRSIRDQGVTGGGRIRIEDGCWIGQGAAIICSKGELVIGRNSVVGANSVVTKSVPPYSVVGGSPARPIKRYDPNEKAWVKCSVLDSEMEALEEMCALGMEHASPR